MEERYIELIDGQEDMQTIETMEVETQNTLWVTVGHISDVAGIASLLISIVTVVLAAQIKLKVRKQVAKNDYIVDADRIIYALSAFCANLTKDKEIVDQTIFFNIAKILDELLLNYDEILPKTLISDIKETRKYIENKFLQQDWEAVNKNELLICSRKLNAIKTRLAKEKKEL